MKQSLGRGLDDLMPTTPADRSAPAGPDGLGARGGVDRLLDGGSQLELGESVPRNATQSGDAESRMARVPSWVFYLSDVVLMGAVVWMIALSPEPLTRNQGLTCLVLVLLAAGIGLWPWLRNVLYCQSLGAAAPLPNWAVAERVEVGGVSKTLVIHLRQPSLAVEMSETAWQGLNAKPHWIQGAPNLPPGGVRELLDEATVFFQKWKSEQPRSQRGVSEDPSLTAPNDSTV